MTAVERDQTWALFYQARDMKHILPQKRAEVESIEQGLSYVHLAMWRMEKTFRAYFTLMERQYSRPRLMRDQFAESVITLIY